MAISKKSLNKGQPAETVHAAPDFLKDSAHLLNMSEDQLNFEIQLLEDEICSFEEVHNLDLSNETPKRLKSEKSTKNKKRLATAMS